MNVGPIILRNQIEDLIEILESVRSSGLYWPARELGTVLARLRPSRECAVNLTACHRRWAQWWAHPATGRSAG
jgi:hypothetical protein